MAGATIVYERVTLARFAVLITHRDILGSEPRIADLHTTLGGHMKSVKLFKTQHNVALKRLRSD
jgi:hypothetical protein